MLILLVTGSRNITDEKFIYSCLDKTYKEIKFDALFHGDAVGVDRIAKQWATERGVREFAIKPNWKLGIQAGLVRNSDLVKICDRGIAIWDKKSRGTQDCITKLKKAEKLLEIFIYSQTVLV